MTGFAIGRFAHAENVRGFSWSKAVERHFNSKSNPARGIGLAGGVNQ